MRKAQSVVAMAVVMAVASSGPPVRSQETQAPFLPPRNLGPVETYGRHIARTMATLGSATPEHRPTVRILFYGQSITEQEWSKAVADDLRRRYPNADLVIENRAIGGHASQLLVKTAEADLYPFQPDLVIFHVYGAHTDYETITRRIRERTTAEILMQTDHLARDDKLDSEFPELYATTRVSPYPGSNWPCLLKVGCESQRFQEKWTLTLTEIGPEFTTGRFRIEGSRTGPDGDGSLEERFVSKSGRVVIEPGDWNLGYCLKVFGKRIEPGFAITWSDVLLGTDEVGPAPSPSAGSETTKYLAVGLPPGKHRLELTGPGVERIGALRVYRPPLWGATTGH